MIDFTLGAITGGLLVFLFYHFGPQASKAFALTLEQRIKSMVTQAAQDIVTAVEALPAKLGAQAEATLSAEQANHADDLTAISTAVAAITPPDGQ